jgi:hypothetical protein
VDLAEFRRPTGPSRNKVDDLLDKIAEDDPALAATVREALEGDRAEFPTRTIAVVLTRNGWPVGDSAVNTWRRNNCA